MIRRLRGNRDERYSSILKQLKLLLIRLNRQVTEWAPCASIYQGEEKSLRLAAAWLPGINLAYRFLSLRGVGIA
jgi:hypothetical protein